MVALILRGLTFLIAQAVISLYHNKVNQERGIMTSIYRSSISKFWVYRICGSDYCGAATTITLEIVRELMPIYIIRLATVFP
jgi:hypothetical protein